MTYFRPLADEGLNCPVNRPLVDGAAAKTLRVLRMGWRTRRAAIEPDDVRRPLRSDPGLSHWPLERLLSVDSVEKVLVWPVSQEFFAAQAERKP